MGWLGRWKGLQVRRALAGGNAKSCYTDGIASASYSLASEINKVKLLWVFPGRLASRARNVRSSGGNKGVSPFLFHSTFRLDKLGTPFEAPLLQGLDWVVLHRIGLFFRPVFPFDWKGCGTPRPRRAGLGRKWCCEEAKHAHNCVSLYGDSHISFFTTLDAREKDRWSMSTRGAKKRR